jgi:hypothetical protein
MGRPRIDPESAAAVQIGVRLPDRLYEDFMRQVARTDAKRLAQGLPGVVSASGLARLWIEERLAIEVALAKEAGVSAGSERLVKSRWEWIREHALEARAEALAKGKPRKAGAE